MHFLPPIAQLFSIAATASHQLWETSSSHDDHSDDDATVDDDNHVEECSPWGGGMVVGAGKAHYTSSTESAMT